MSCPPTCFESVPKDRKLPSALECLDAISGKLKGKQAVVFLDYDGTLTPIVERPELAVLSASMRSAVSRLVRCCRVAVISGRDRADVAQRMGLAELIYAGSHGFDISGPDGLHLECEGGRSSLAALAAAHDELLRRLQGVAGVQLEPKKYALAVHYRRVAAGDLPVVEAAVADVASCHSELQRSGGKKVFELRPNLDWDKGKAMFWLLGQLGLDGVEVLPFYLGDDLTDEDAFRALRQRKGGVGIVVGDPGRPSAAHCALANTEEVGRFLHSLSDLMANRGKEREGC